MPLSNGTNAFVIIHLVGASKRGIWISSGRLVFHTDNSESSTISCAAIMWSKKARHFRMCAYIVYAERTYANGQVFIM